MLTNKQIALVHVACKELGISEDDRHLIQEEIGGARSLKKMSEAGWRALVRHFEERGFRAYPPVSVAGPLRDSPESAGDSKSRLMRKLYAEWRDLAGVYYEPGKERAALRGFLRKRLGVDHERFLTAEQAIKAIEAVKAIKARKLGGRKARKP